MPQPDLNVIAEDAVRALHRSDPIKFLESFDRLSAGYLLAMGWNIAELRDVRDVALRTYLTGARTHLDLSAAIGPRALRWLTTANPSNVAEVHVLWMQERMAKWTHGRRIYRLHPATTAALLASVDMDTVIPGEILHMLPHPDAFVWLPHPILASTPPSPRLGGFGLRADHEISEVYGGFFINGTTADGIGCHLDHADATSVHVEFVGLAYTAGVIAPMSFRMKVPMDGYYSLESLADQNAKETDSYSDATADEVAPLLSMALAVLTYLASVGVEIAERRPSRKNRRDVGRGAVSRQFDVGYRVGAALSAGHREQASFASRGTSGHRVAAHIRRGHFHTYRHGEGKRLSKVRWLAPIAVNSGRSDAAEITTMHRVGA